MARRKSYFAKANRGNAVGVFLNNCVASAEKSRRDSNKAADKARRDSERAAKQRDREYAKRQKEADRQQRQIEAHNLRVERENERIRKQEERMNAKISKLAERVKLELEKLEFEPVKAVCQKIALDADAAGVTATQIKSLLINGKEDQIAKLVVEEFLNTKIPVDYRVSKEFKAIVARTHMLRPLTANEIQKDPETKTYLNGVLAKVKADREAEKERKRKASERDEVFATLKKKGALFSSDFGRLKSLAVRKDWDGELLNNSEELLKMQNDKKIYLSELKERLKPFKVDSL